MKIPLIFSILLCSFCVSVINGQSEINQFLSEIESNNKMLRAKQKQYEAQKINNKTGLLPNGPEIEFAHLWGDPLEIGNRIDFAVTQSFDFPSIYGIKRDIADLKNERMTQSYAEQKRSVLIFSVGLLNEFFHCHRKGSMLLKRLDHATSIYDSYNKKFELGESTIIEMNKAKLNALHLEHEVSLNDIRLSEIKGGLRQLNGGMDPSIPEKDISAVLFGTDFKSWYQKALLLSPELDGIQQEIAISQMNEKLTKTMKYPSFETAYMSESVVNEQFRGLSLGIHLPLWENKNQMASAKAQTAALKSVEDKLSADFYSKLEIQYRKMLSLREELANFKQQLSGTAIEELLKKALDAGEISLIEYYTELGMYYESQDAVRELEFELKEKELILYIYQRN